MSTHADQTSCFRALPAGDLASCPADALMRVRLTAPSDAHIDDLSTDREYEVAAILVSTKRDVSLLLTTQQGPRLARAVLFDVVDPQIPSAWSGVRNPAPDIELWLGPTATGTSRGADD